jgi:hypothetical protein
VRTRPTGQVTSAVDTIESEGKERVSTAVSAKASVASPRAVERSFGALRQPRLATWIAWGIIGAIGTWADHIHQWAGVSAYPNTGWVGELLPASPIYVAAGVGYFALYVVVVGLRHGSDALLGGGHRDAAEVAYAVTALLAGYAVTALAGGAGRGEGWGPFLGAAILALWAAPSYWRLRKTRVPIYAGWVILLGCGFEWLATALGGFSYPVCPATACLGTTVPMLWLPLLYAHVALFFHRLAGGPHSMLV